MSNVINTFWDFPPSTKVDSWRINLLLIGVVISSNGYSFLYEFISIITFVGFKDDVPLQKYISSLKMESKSVLLVKDIVTSFCKSDGLYNLKLFVVYPLPSQYFPSDSLIKI